MSLDHVHIDGFRVALDPHNWPPKLVRALLRRHYERMERRMVRDMLAPGERVIELGASLGVVALGIARRVGAANLVSFDANNDVLAIARDNFARNGAAIALRNQLLVSRADAAKTGRRARFFTTPYFLSSSILPHRDDMTRIEVETAVLEEVIAASRAEAVVADIEGGEIALFASAELGPIDKLLIELHPDRTSIAACMDLIARLREQELHLHAPAIEGSVYYFSRADAPLGGREHSAIAAFMSGGLAAERGESDAAIAAFETAIEAIPGNAYFRSALARQLAAAGRMADALDANLVARALAPGNEDYHEQHGGLLLAIGRHDEAADAFRNALAFAPDRPLFFAGLGQALAGAGHVEQARAVLETALAMDPVEINPRDMFVREALDRLGSA